LIKKFATILTILLMSVTGAQAEPWVDTDDVFFRADIERLSRVGVITVPVNTWPLTWSPIINDLNRVDKGALSPDLLSTFLRVKRRSQFETHHDTKSYLSLKVANQADLIRNFGESVREEAAAGLRVTNMSDTFAWNIEYTHAQDPIDGEEERLDGSYLSKVWGNWIVSVGAQERWWGPGWDSSLILSNNARPVSSISLQRNNSEAFETPWLSWIGPWTMTAFAGQLESDRFVPHTKLLGLSVSFRPFESLEIGLRRTAQWGGDGRPETASSFFDMLIGLDNCDEGDLSCEDRSEEPGNQLAGLDIKWHLPFDSFQSSLYGQLIGEDEAGYAPSRKVYQLGIDADLYFSESAMTVYLEYADTENEYSPNLTYNNGIYQTGYRTEGFNIASTFDNDTQSLTFGAVTNFKSGNSINLSVSKIDMNSDNVDGNHSISSNAIDFTRLKLGYRVPTKYGRFDFEVKANSERIDSFGRQDERFTAGINWTLEI